MGVSQLKLCCHQGLYIFVLITILFLTLVSTVVLFFISGEHLRELFIVDLKSFFLPVRFNLEDILSFYSSFFFNLAPFNLICFSLSVSIMKLLSNLHNFSFPSISCCISFQILFSNFYLLIIYGYDECCPSFQGTFLVAFVYTECWLYCYCFLSTI